MEMPLRLEDAEELTSPTFPWQVHRARLPKICKARKTVGLFSRLSHISLETPVMLAFAAAAPDDFPPNRYGRNKTMNEETKPL
jgi:hypothetical protein